MNTNDVKEGAGRVVGIDDGLHIDMDATALYPSMMMQNNISFDSFYGRIVDPLCYSILSHLTSVLGTNDGYAQGLHNKIFDCVKKYVDKLEPQNKNDYKQAMYFIIMDCLLKLKLANRPVKALFNPETKRDYILLKRYMIPFLDLITEVSESGEEYNTFAYEHILNNRCPNIDKLLVIENANDPSIKVIEIDPTTFKDYLVTNDLCFNIAGVLFYTHEKRRGVVNNFLIDRLAMRKQYKTERNQYEESSEDYKFNDRRQLACKVNANSSYGLTGMSGFRFSNKWLAKSTTLSGKLCLKIAQACGELYLQTENNKENPEWSIK